MQPTSDTIEVSDVSVGFQERTILTNVSFSLRLGQSLAIMGGSGLGKTTLIRTLAGFHHPISGKISFYGQNKIGALYPASIVTQRNSLLPWFSVLDNVAIPLRVMNVRKSDARQLASASLSDIGMVSYSDFFPSQLSGGMQQRVQLARCLVTHPRTILLDEPFSSLDHDTRDFCIETLQKYRSKYSPAIIMVTHSEFEASRLSDRVSFLSGSPATIV